MCHFTGDTVRIQDQIHKAGRDRTAGHTVKLGALGRLGNDHSVPLLDGPDPVGTVRTGSRKDHRDRTVLVGLGQRPEKDINRMIDMLVVIFVKMKNIFLDFHIVFGRQHVDCIFADMHTVLDFQYRHRGIFAQDIRQKTAVVRRKMLNHNKSHACIGRKKCQKLL